MGTYCSIKFDGADIVSTKSVLPDAYASLFHEGDRRTTYDEEYEREDVVYVASREVILERLDLLGFTLDAARSSFERWLKYTRIQLSDYDFGAERLALLNSYTFDNWRMHLRSALQHRYDLDYVPADEIEGLMCDSQENWLIWVADERLVIRAMLDELKDVKEVILDTAGLVEGSYIDGEPGLLDRIREEAVGRRQALDPIVIIGEGVSDTDVLRTSLGALYPEVAGYFSFFDHGELSVDGGASYLVKFLRAFGAARIATRLVAVFDNDAVGRDAFDEVSKLPLPSNIAFFRLPDIEFANLYSTIGPQGQSTIDVNGRAASIELYLGQHNLMEENGQVRPVYWSGPVKKTGIYQGALQNKSEISKRFFADIRIARSPSENRERYPELVEVWSGIFDLLRKVNTADVIAEDAMVTDLF